MLTLGQMRARLWAGLCVAAGLLLLAWALRAGPAGSVAAFVAGYAAYKALRWLPLIRRARELAPPPRGTWEA